MKKVNSTALAGLALSALLATGCENFAKQEDLVDVQSALKLANVQLQKTEDDLEQVQSELALAEEAIEVLEGKVETPDAEGSLFSKLTLTFNHWDAAPDAEDEIGRRATFQSKLAGYERDWKEDFHILRPSGTNQLELVPKTGFMTGRTQDKILKQVESIIGGADIAAVKARNDQPVTVEELIVNYTSTSGAVKAKHKLDCPLKLFYNPEETTNAVSTIYWYFTAENGETKAQLGEIEVDVAGKPETIGGVKVCKPIPGSKTVYFMVLSKTTSAVVAQYRELTTEGLTVQHDKLVLAPLTEGLPGCPPGNWSWRDTEKDNKLVSWPQDVVDVFTSQLGGKCASEPPKPA